MLANNLIGSKGMLALILALKSVPGMALGANLAVHINPATNAAPDAAYPGSFIGENGTGPASVSLSGENYGIDAEFPDLVWGLGVNHLAGDTGVFWVVDNGFEPSAPGSLTYDDGNGHVLPASWLSVQIDTSGQETLFQGLTVELSGITGLATSNAWYGSSTDSYGMAGQLHLTDDQTSLIFTLPDFTHSGGGPLEVRIYGLRGTDIGGFSLLNIEANMVQVPEPNAMFLIAAVALAALVQRFRR